jgi:hypothetical protein
MFDLFVHSFDSITVCLILVIKTNSRVIHRINLTSSFTFYHNPTMSASKANLTADSTPSLQPEAVRKVLDDPILLSRILGFLDDGHARDLVTALQVSKAFFHGAASTLCRRIEVPQFEYSATKHRDEVLYAKPCVSCYGEEPVTYKRPKGVTSHRSVQPGGTRRSTKRSHLYYRIAHPATPNMREMYRHVRVITVEQHDLCDQLAVVHPIPLVRTVIVRGGHKSVCNPFQPGLRCGFLPTHPFRLVLDGLCGAMLCKDCTSFRLLSPKVETLVLKIRYSLERFYCNTMKLPSDFNPSKLVILFPCETLEPRLDTQDKTTREHHLWALGPGDIKPDPEKGRYGNTKKYDMMSNTFYRLAKLCLAVGNKCKIYIVGADHGALHMRGFELQDPSLDAFEPLFPRPEGPEDRYNFEQSLRNPNNTDSDKQAEVGVDEDEDKWTDNHTFPYACFDQNGCLVSAIRPRGPIPSIHLPAARHMVDTRVEIMKRILHRWIDYILNSRLPAAHFEDEKDKFQDRDAFETYLAELNDQNSLQDQQIWHQNHKCGYHCRSYSPDIPESDQGENTIEDQDAWENKQEDDDERDWSAWRNDPDEMSDWERLDKEMSKEEAVEGFKRKVEMKDIKRKDELEDVEGEAKARVWAKTREEIEYKRMMRHKNISFITTHQYHLVEGNNDEMDDPNRYL